MTDHLMAPEKLVELRSANALKRCEERRLIRADAHRRGFQARRGRRLSQRQAGLPMVLQHLLGKSVNLRVATLRESCFGLEHFKGVILTSRLNEVACLA